MTDEPEVRDEISGQVSGYAVQAGRIEDGVHFHGVPVVPDEPPVPAEPPVPGARPRRTTLAMPGTASVLGRPLPRVSA